MEWQTALITAITPYLRDEFGWGRFDCMQLLRAYFALLNNQKSIADHLTYSSEAEAMEILNREGGMIKMISSLLGSPKQTPEPGDVVVVRLLDSMAGGIYNGHYVIACSPHGLCRVASDQILRAWDAASAT